MVTKRVIGFITKEKTLKTATTTDWDLLLSSKCAVKTLSKFATGEQTTRGVTSCFSNTERANLPGGTASWPAPVVVDNATYEYRLNEENREIKFLNESLIETFEEEFKEKIQ